MVRLNSEIREREKGRDREIDSYGEIEAERDGEIEREKLEMKEKRERGYVSKTLHKRVEINPNTIAPSILDLKCLLNKKKNIFKIPEYEIVMDT